ncbi:MAG: signal transduction histidine kinase, partial [Thermoleophilia bacterium]|nr:signal transduction histidine kinase [Thermoleophilia bacterium]
PGNAPGQAGSYTRALDDEGEEIATNQQSAACRERQQAQRAQQPPPQFDESALSPSLREEFRSSRVELPISAAARKLARGTSTELLHETVQLDGNRYRIVSGRVDGVDEFGREAAYTVQVARPLAEQDDFLHRLLLLLVAVTIIGVAVSVAAAMIVTGAASQPIHRLTRLTQEIRTSRDLSQRVQATGNDDLARLAVSFNAMLDELERSNVRQQRLVDDASHQLRTPLASIRTNMDVLIRAKSLDAQVVRDIMGDLSAQVDELTSLVRDLVDLASSVESSLEREPVRLDEAAEEAVRRVRGAFPDLRFETHLEPMLVEGSAERLVRMVQNLLHNAGKWSPADSTVELHIEHSTLRVVDHGSGVADAEKARIFERFHRAADARDIPGSGLGLAIVQQVAIDHGGDVSVEDTPGGGATFVVRLPPLDH